MDIIKQTLLLEYLISSVDTFALCTSIIKPSYFDPELRNTVMFIQTYYEEYNSLPEPIQIEAETGIDLEKRIITKDKIEYCSREIEKFCKRKAIEKAIIASPKLIEEGDYGKVEQLIKDAVTVSLNTDLGLNIFDDPYNVLMNLSNNDNLLSTGWANFDEKLGGGIRRKEMVIFSANSGGGKSLVLANYALNQMEKGLNVLYISLELSQELVAKRYFSMITGIKQIELFNNISDTAYKIKEAQHKHGELYIKRMPTGSTPAKFRSYLKEFELKRGYVPDVLVVDYLDIMSPNERVKAGDVFEKDKLSAEQVRDIGEDYNMIIATASQQNRTAVGVDEVNQSHIAGGISKANTTDIWASIVFNDQLKAQGIMKFFLLKTRSSDGVGQYVDLKWNPSSLRITNGDDGASPLVFNKRSNMQKPSGSTLLNIIEK